MCLVSGHIQVYVFSIRIYPSACIYYTDISRCMYLLSGHIQGHVFTKRTYPDACIYYPDISRYMYLLCGHIQVHLFTIQTYPGTCIYYPDISRYMYLLSRQWECFPGGSRGRQAGNNNYVDKRLANGTGQIYMKLLSDTKFDKRKDQQIKGGWGNEQVIQSLENKQ